MLKKIEALIKINKSTAFDEDVMDLKVMLEEQLPAKTEATKFKMIFRDIENVNLGTNPALLNDKPKIVTANTYSPGNRD